MGMESSHPPPPPPPPRGGGCGVGSVAATVKGIAKNWEVINAMQVMRLMAFPPIPQN